MSIRNLFLKEEAARLSTAERRAASIPTHDLVQWVETAVMEVGRCLDRYRHSTAVEDVIEAESAGQTVQVLLAELRSRSVRSS